MVPMPVGSINQSVPSVLAVSAPRKAGGVACRAWSDPVLVVQAEIMLTTSARHSAAAARHQLNNEPASLLGNHVMTASFPPASSHTAGAHCRSEERRVGKKCR